MKKIIWILLTISTLLDDVTYSALASSYFQITYGEDKKGVPLKEEFFQCDQNHYCTNVVKTKDGKYETVSGGNALKNLKDLVCVWKKIRYSAECKVVSPLGMQSKAIPNGRITASSVHGQYVPHLGRLNGRNCWYAKGGDHQSYFQVDFGQRTLVYAVATQGQSGGRWVKTYMVTYGSDGKSFQTVLDPSTSVEKVFIGNKDGVSIVKNDLPAPVETRFIRLLPKTRHGWIALRVEFYGCYIPAIV